MAALSHQQTFRVLLQQAAGEGRGAVLFGDSLQRAQEAVPPFLVGDEFPYVYLEHPLIDDPSLDVTLVLGPLEPGTRIDSPAAGEHGSMLDQYAELRGLYNDVCFGFEIDTKEPTLPMAGIHFQPRAHTELVRPFCEAIGEPERAGLYLDLAARIPDTWSLSYFGMFRGRPGSPLRVCGYLDDAERVACAQDAGRLREVFETVGFSAYDDAMLAQASALMEAATGCRSIDFQFDVFPDGRLGEVFAFDVSFVAERPEGVRKSFADGTGAHVMQLFEGWGIADGRWQLAVESAFARSVLVQTAFGETRPFALALTPKWAKARWTRGVLQPAKLYHLMKADFLDE